MVKEIITLNNPERFSLSYNIDRKKIINAAEKAITEDVKKAMTIFSKPQK